MSKSQVEIVENAERLAADLQAGPTVGKNALLAVIGTFLSDPASDVQRLRRTIVLLKEGSGGHLKRGRGYSDQVRLVAREVSRILERGEWQPQELKSLFGWTARLLLVRQEPRRERDSRTEADSFETPPAKSAPPTPASTVTWQNVELRLVQGNVTAYRGKQVAACSRSGVDKELVTALAKKKSLRADVEVLKVADSQYRIDRILRWSAPTR